MTLKLITLAAVIVSSSFLTTIAFFETRKRWKPFWRRRRARRASRRLRRELLFFGYDVSSWTDQELSTAAIELGWIAERSTFTFEEATKAFALLGAACRQAEAFGTSLEAASEEIATAITPSTRDAPRQGRLDDGDGLGTVGPIPNTDLEPMRRWIDDVDEKHHGDIPGYLAPGVYEDDEGDGP